MATLASGVSIALTLNAGQSVDFVIGGQGFAIRGPGIGAGQVIGLGSQPTTIGPFPVQQVLYVTATNGQLTYTVYPSAQVSDPRELVQADPSGQIILPSGEIMQSVIYRTFATLPAASTYIGQAFVTDVGPSGSWWRSNGSSWGLVNGSVDWYTSGVAGTTLTGTTTETNQYTSVLPGGLLGANGIVQVTGRITTNNTAGVKFVYLKYGGTLLNVAGVSNSIGASFQVEFMNRGSASSQIGGNDGLAYGAVNTNAFRTGTVNSAADQTLLVSAQLATAGDSFKLESLAVKIIRP